MADRRCDVYYGRQRAWAEEQRALRAILLTTPLVEAFKWRSPVYTWEGANVAIVWAFRDRCGLGFFKGVLLKDPAGILTAPGENSRSARKAAFTDLAAIEAAARTLRAYVDEAIALEKAGAKVDLPKDDLAYPQELTARLADDPALAAAFDALSPGRRRGWLLHFGQARRPKTRATRIDRATPMILAGKGMHDR